MVTPNLCPRCEHALPFEPDGTLAYCPSCGAPQVRVSGQLLEEIEERRHTEQENAVAYANAADRSAGRNLLQTAGLTGGVAIALSLLSLLLPPAVLLLWFWVVGAPVVALGLYIARHRVSAPGVELTAGSNAGLGSGLAHGLGPGLSPGLGARLGFLSGLAILLALALVNTISLLLVRYGLHKTAGLDGQLAILFAQMRSTAEAQYGAAAAVPFLGLLRVPEFRAGLLLSSLLLFTTGYLLLTTLGGAFAGLLRRNSTSPS